MEVVNSGKKKRENHCFQKIVSERYNKCSLYSIYRQEMQKEISEIHRPGKDTVTKIKMEML